MRRRNFLEATLTLGLAGATPTLAGSTLAKQAKVFPKRLASNNIAGITLEELRDDYHHRLFNEYLPFWEKEAIDKQYGGIMCELNADGTVYNGLKNSWYQGRGLWVYSFLYNNFGRDQRWLDVANGIYKFLSEFMAVGAGKWVDKTERNGKVIDGVNPVIYGSLFIAEGLIEYGKATGNKRHIELAKESIRIAIKSYDSPDYNNIGVSYTVAKVPSKGLRSLGHSMVLLRVLSQLLAFEQDPEFEVLIDEHLDAILNRFWNSDYGITNEFLMHDYSRFNDYAGCMYTGHAIETYWMVMSEAIRRKDENLFSTANDRIQRLIELSWDYIFDGCASMDYLVFDIPGYSRGPKYEVKMMWTHCEIMIGCMTAIEYTGKNWAKEWYQRTRTFTHQTMPCEAQGVWRQAVDRLGKDRERKKVQISPKRRGNYHQPRYLMLNLLSLNRMIQNKGQLTPFPINSD